VVAQQAQSTWWVVNLQGTKWCWGYSRSVNGRGEWQAPRCSLHRAGGGAWRAYRVIGCWRALPAYTFLPGCPQRTARPQGWTCQRAPRSPSYEGSGAQWQGRRGITAWHRPPPSRQQIPDYRAERQASAATRGEEGTIRGTIFWIWSKLFPLLFWQVLSNLWN